MKSLFEMMNNIFSIPGFDGSLIFVANHMTLSMSHVGTACGYSILTGRLSAFRYVMCHPSQRDYSRLSEPYFWPGLFLIASL